MKSARSSRARRISCVTSLEPHDVRHWSGVQDVRRERQRLEITATDAEKIVRRLLVTDNDLTELEVSRAGLAEAFNELHSGDRTMSTVMPSPSLSVPAARMRFRADADLAAAARLLDRSSLRSAAHVAYAGVPHSDGRVAGDALCVLRHRALTATSRCLRRSPCRC